MFPLQIETASFAKLAPQSSVVGGTLVLPVGPLQRVCHLLTPLSLPQIYHLPQDGSGEEHFGSRVAGVQNPRQGAV